MNPISSYRPLRRLLVAAAASLALLTSAAVVAPTAMAATPGSATVAVTTPLGASVGIEHQVTIYRASDGYWLEDDYTDTDGEVTFSDLQPGAYTLWTEPGDGFSGQYYGGSIDLAHAQSFVVNADANTLVSFQASAGQAVSGRVVNKAGLPVSGVDVYANFLVTDDGSPYWNDVNEDETDVNGNYTLTGVLAGTWTVSTYPDSPYTPTWYGNTANYLDAAHFDVTRTTGRSGVNITVATGSTIGGVIKGANGIPVGGGSVLLWKYETDVWGTTQLPCCGPWTGTGINPNGEYSFSQLPAGTYALFVQAVGQPGQFVGGVTDAGGATRIKVGTGENKALNITLVSNPAVAPSSSSIATGAHVYGKATAATVSVTGKLVDAVGTVTLLDNGKSLGTKTLNGGKAGFTLPATLSVGKHTLSVKYVSSGLLKSSTSVVKVLTVTKASSKVKTSVNKKKTKLTATVSAAGVVPGGKVTVTEGKKKVGTATLKKGKVTISLKKLKAGKHKLKVSYAGSATVKSSSVKVSVKR